LTQPIQPIPADRHGIIGDWRITRYGMSENGRSSTILIRG
jgi:hypothetical protein